FQQIQGAMADSTEVSSGSGGSGERETAPRGNVDTLGDQTGAIDYGGSASSSKNSSSGGVLSNQGGALAAGLGIVPEEFQQIQGAMADSTEAWSGGGGSGERDTAPRGNVDSLGDQTGAIDYGSSASSSKSSSSGGVLSDLGGALAAGLGIVPL